MPDITVEVGYLNTDVEIGYLEIGASLDTLNIDATVGAPDIPVTMSALNVDVEFGCCPDYFTMLQGAMDYMGAVGRVYNSDESAGLAGVEIGGLYRTSPDHVEVAGGLPKIRLV